MPTLTTVEVCFDLGSNAGGLGSVGVDRYPNSYFEVHDDNTLGIYENNAEEASAVYNSDCWKKVKYV